MAQSPARSPADVTTLSLQPGDTMDAYTVVGTIATTGSAVVYKAHDALLDRHVAIKQLILGSGDTDASLRRRIRDEAAIHKRVSATQPRHLVQFIDAVDDPRGLMLVSEYYPSTSLEEMLDQRKAPLDERQALGIVAATAKGLEAIHAMGVLHRDLKPSNILLGTDGGLKICDFGLAALIEAQDSLSLGSVRYMAPELLRGEPADPRADIYSLGVIAYEMLAGRVHFDTAFRNVLRDTRNQAMRWMKWHTNLRVSAPLLSEYLPDLPPHLVQLVARMMDKDQARRVGSAVDVLEAIRRHFIGDKDALADLGPESGKPPGLSTSTGGDTAPLPSRSKLPLILAGLLAFWVVVGGGLLWYSNHQRETRQAAARAEAEGLISTGIARYNEGDFVASLESYTAVLGNWPEDSSIHSRAQLGAWKARGRIAFNEARYGEAIDAFEQYRKNGGDASTVEPLILEARAGEAFATIDKAVLASIQGNDFRGAQQVVRDARENQWNDGQVRRLDELDALIEQRRAEVLATERIAQARQLQAGGDIPAAIAALEDLVSLPEEGTQLLASLRNDLAHSQAIAAGREAERTGNLAGAVAAYNQALAIKPDNAIALKVRQLDAQRLIADAARLIDAGEFEGAIPRLEEALRLDPDNPDAARYKQQIASVTQLGNLERQADAALAAGKYDEAIDLYGKALRISPTSTSVSDKLTNTRARKNKSLATAALEGGDLDRAQSLLEAALQLKPDDAEAQRMLDGLSNRRAIAGFIADGDADYKIGEFARARRAYNEALRIIPQADTTLRESVALKIADSEFEQWMAAARQAYKDGNLVAARANLQQARKIRITKELDEMLQRIDNPPTPPAEGTAPLPAPGGASGDASGLPRVSSPAVLFA